MIETVEAGAVRTTDDVRPAFKAAVNGFGTEVLVGFVWSAYKGSLDAAKSLHEKLLPGCSAVIQTNGTVQTIGPNYERHTGVAVDAPARAWLIAILKAYEATTHA